MSNFIEGTEFELGKWYVATDHRPPDILSPLNKASENYEMLLGIQSLGIRHGFYDFTENRFYWHCERYDSFDDEPVPGWTREQEINNNLELVYEKARGVICWMVVPDFDNDLPSVDGTNYFDPDPDQDWTIKDDNDEEEGDSSSIIPLHLN